VRVAKIKPVNFVLGGLPLSYMLNDALMFEFGGIYITPYKVVLLLSALLLFKPFVSGIYSKNKFLSSLSLLFIFYCLILWLSVFYSRELSFSQRINYLMFIFFEIIIIVGILFKLQKMNISTFIFPFIKIMSLIFFSSLFLATAQLLLQNQLLYTGLFASRKITYAITGFNIERLFLSEFLVIGLSIILFLNKYKPLLRIALTVWVGVLIFYSGSFTGILGFLGLIFFIRKKVKLKTVLIFIPILLLVTIVIKPNFQSVKPNSKLFSLENKFESYFINYSQENWRFISSLSLAKNFITNPTIFGHGYMSNAVFLKNVNYIYSKNKFGIGKATDKESSSHTFFTILYDQGILGFFIFIIFFMKLFKKERQLYRSKVNKSLSHIDLFNNITFIIVWLMMLRFFFYYHTLNHWHYLISIIFLNGLSFFKVKAIS